MHATRLLIATTEKLMGQSLLGCCLYPQIDPEAFPLCFFLKVRQVCVLHLSPWSILS